MLLVEVVQLDPGQSELLGVVLQHLLDLQLAQSSLVLGQGSSKGGLDLMTLIVMDGRLVVLFEGLRGEGRVVSVGVRERGEGRVVSVGVRERGEGWMV